MKRKLFLLSVLFIVLFVLAGCFEKEKEEIPLIGDTISLEDAKAGYVSALSDMIDAKVLVGYEKSEDVLRSVTREEFAKIVVWIGGFEASLNRYYYAGIFSDISRDHENYANIEIASTQGFLQTEGDVFDAGGQLKYEDACRGILWAMGYTNYGSQIAYVNLAKEKGVVSGVADSSMGNNMNLGMLCKMLSNGVRQDIVQLVKKTEKKLFQETTVNTYVAREGTTILSKYIEGNDSESSLFIVGNDGWDIFDGNGYMYAPSMIINKDGTIDLWAAKIPEQVPEVDWGTYKRSYDGGKTWTSDMAAVRPTPYSEDWFWTCDAATFKMGDYYYCFWTSILPNQGYDNNLFVGRSKNPAGPFDEKWSGSYWGDDPKPIITYDGKFELWGIGEGSGLIKDDTIYIYATYLDYDTKQQPMGELVYTAPANDENWPGKMTYRNVAFSGEYTGGGQADVKYVDAYDMFIAIQAQSPNSSRSHVRLWVSYDGITFRKEADIDKNTLAYLHNVGITAGESGHVNIHEINYIGYAYQKNQSDEWGHWPTRFAPVAWLGSEWYTAPETLPQYDSGLETDLKHTPDVLNVYVAERILKVYPNSSSSIKVSYVDKERKIIDITGDKKIKYTYDKSKAEIDEKNATIKLLSDESVRVYVEYGGRRIDFIAVNPEMDKEIVSFRCEVPEIRFRFMEQIKQPGFILKAKSGEYTMLQDLKEVQYEEYDTNIIIIDRNGFIKAKAKGQTQIKISYKEFSTVIPVIVE